MESLVLTWGTGHKCSQQPSPCEIYSAGFELAAASNPSLFYPTTPHLCSRIWVSWELWMETYSLFAGNKCKLWPLRHFQELFLINFFCFWQFCPTPPFWGEEGALDSVFSPLWGNVSKFEAGLKDSVFSFWRKKYAQRKKKPQLKNKFLWPSSIYLSGGTWWLSNEVVKEVKGENNTVSAVIWFSSRHRDGERIRTPQEMSEKNLNDSGKK